MADMTNPFDPNDEYLKALKAAGLSDLPLQHLSATYLSELKLASASTLAEELYRQSRSLPTTLTSIAASTDIQSAERISNTLSHVINPALQLFGQKDLAGSHLVSALESLTTLSDPLGSLSQSEKLERFSGALTSFGSATDIAQHYLSSNLVNLGGESSASGLIASYLAAASAVEGFESSLAQAAQSLTLPGVYTTSHLLPGVTLDTATQLHSSVSGLAAIARSSVSTAFLDAGLRVHVPALEVYTSAHLARALTLRNEEPLATDDDTEAALDHQRDEFEDKLASLDADLVTLYRGALQAMDDGRPDWQRHAMTSLRELVSHVLHRLTPDGAIIPQAGAGDLYQGRPTRKFRLKIIFGTAIGPDLTQFFEADMAAAVELFDVLNKGTHKLGQTASPDQARYLTGRVVGLVTSMLDATNAANQARNN
ncbi:hypothetical protein BWI17_18230 [Betaproteobacteria bacterium GR16-43]|nr:hypothetical protein BWI17_18230 [Betaproteobacteria bacterium GR16-43]